MNSVVRCLAAAVAVLSFAVVGAAQSLPASPPEAELIAVLRSDAPPAEKALACKRLAIVGSAESVEAAAALLPDPDLSSWARITLEAIPGPEADAALRDAVASVEGRLLIGVLNSIGVRRDAEAVSVLASRLEDDDAGVASAAAVALGRIGDPASAEALRDLLAKATRDEVRSAAAEGCILIGEARLAAGQSAAAAEIYDLVRGADLPQQRILEATRGAILAREDGLDLLLEQLASDDPKMFQLALGVIREFPGAELDRQLARQWSQAEPSRGALILQAMADRGETVVLESLVEAAARGADEVRISAVDALGRVGDASCLKVLLDAALESNQELAEAARLALIALPGEKVDGQLVALLRDAEDKNYPLLIELAGQRRLDAVPELVAALKRPQAEIRRAALSALGETVTLQRLPVLIEQATSSAASADAETALQALRTASVRMPDRDACVAELSKAMARSSAATRVALLEILSEVGGSAALQRLAEAARSDSDALQDAGSRLLGKWNSVDAAPVLLDLAKSAPQDRYRIRALRGYIGLARKFQMPEDERATMCRQAMALAAKPAERQLVLDVLVIHPSSAGLGVVAEALDQPDSKQAATEAALAIAQKLGGQAQVVETLEKIGLQPVKLEILSAQYGAGEKQSDVTAELQRRAGKLPWIVLPAPNYNAVFGDPAPGEVKQLRVRYRLDGQAGEAVFAENSLILLPRPK